MFSLSTVTEPAEELLSLEGAKLHLRVSDTTEDELIESLIRGARRLTEKETNRRWVTQTLNLSLAGWPCHQPWPGWDHAIGLPVEPIASVDAVRYYDSSGTLQTWSVSNWQTWIDHSPPLVAPAPYCSWPGLQPGKLPAIEVEFTAGTPVASVPDDAVSLVKLVVGYWYEHRGDGDDPTKLGLPLGAERLINILSSRGYR